jgi:hypothetical protein
MASTLDVAARFRSLRRLAEGGMLEERCEVSMKPHLLVYCRMTSIIQ